MKGIVEFVYKNIEVGNPVEIDKVTINNGESFMTMTEFVDKVMTDWTDPIMFVVGLEMNFRFIEEEMIKQGWTEKHCEDKGKGYHNYPRIHIKEKNYHAVLSGLSRKCLKVTFSNYYMISAEKFITPNREFFSLLSRDQYNLLLELSANVDNKDTPSKQAWNGFNCYNPVEIRKEKGFEMFDNLRSGIQGGIIEKRGKKNFYRTAYHYDVTSMYPYIICSIENFPSYATAVVTTDEEVGNHNEYAYWLYPDFHCSTTADIIPAGSIKMKLIRKNDLAYHVYQLFEEKKKYEKGTAAYFTAKLKVNGFIGKLIQKSYVNDIYYSCYSSDKAKHLPVLTYKQQYEIYSYIIAKARQYIESKMKGAKVIQVNTDGFFTEEPIEADKITNKLGALRFEYKAHDLHIFACNQYACNEEVCIAGLPSSIYKKNRICYSLWFPKYDLDQKKFLYNKVDLVLGATNEEQR